MKRFDCPVVAAALAVSVAIFAQSPGLAGPNSDRAIRNGSGTAVNGGTGGTGGTAGTGNPPGNAGINGANGADGKASVQ